MIRYDRLSSKYCSTVNWKIFGIEAPMVLKAGTIGGSK